MLLPGSPARYGFCGARGGEIAGAAAALAGKASTASTTADARSTDATLPGSADLVAPAQLHALADMDVDGIGPTATRAGLLASAA